MNILIAIASRHGRTREIADVIAHDVRAAGHATTVQNAGDVRTIEGYDAVIAGSAIYMGNWLPEARRFVDRNRERLAAVPVWLFSSGPLGENDPQPQGDPAHLDEIMRSVHARDHRIFVGKLDVGELSLVERLVVKMVKAPAGDFRNWAAIHGWAKDIVSALAAPAQSAV